MSFPPEREPALAVIPGLTGNGAGVCDRLPRPLRRRGLLGPHLPLVLDQPLGVVKGPLFPLPAGSDSRPAGMRVESRIGGPALGGSLYYMGRILLTIWGLPYSHGVIRLAT